MNIKRSVSILIVVALLVVTTLLPGYTVEAEEQTYSPAISNEAVELFCDKYGLRDITEEELVEFEGLYSSYIEAKNNQSMLMRSLQNNPEGYSRSSMDREILQANQEVLNLESQMSQYPVVKLDAEDISSLFGIDLAIAQQIARSSDYEVLTTRGSHIVDGTKYYYMVTYVNSTAVSEEGYDTSAPLYVLENIVLCSGSSTESNISNHVSFGLDILGLFTCDTITSILMSLLGISAGTAANTAKNYAVSAQFEAHQAYKYLYISKTESSGYQHQITSEKLWTDLAVRCTSSSSSVGTSWKDYDAQIYETPYFRAANAPSAIEYAISRYNAGYMGIPVYEDAGRAQLVLGSTTIRTLPKTYYSNFQMIPGVS